MKNREFYKDKILNWDKENCGSFCEDFVRPNVLKKRCCTGIPCSFCNAKLSLWLDEEHEEPKEPEVDWSQVAVDTPVFVRNDEEDEWKKRYFAKFEDGDVYTWSSGATSWSEHGTWIWNEVKLAEVNE